MLAILTLTLTNHCTIDTMEVSNLQLAEEMLC
jgi:hypothetical protein